MAEQERHKRGGSDGLRDILLSVGIIMGFVFIVTLAILFIKEHWLVNVCSCSYAIPFLLVGVAALGIFVGIVIYYVLAGRIQQKMATLGRETRRSLQAVLAIIDADERKVIEALLRNNGLLLQSRLDKETGLSRLRAWRTLERLEKKGVVKKERNGKTNTLRLDTNIVNGFTYKVT